MITVNQKPALLEKDSDDEETVKNEDPSIKKETEVEDLKDNHDSSEKNDSGISLPSTATANCQFILCGMIIAAAGGILYMFNKRRTIEK
jgi:uncharacterized surface anchored protein